MFDAHLHLRQADLMHAVVPLIRRGGSQVVTVMPNTVPPITSTQQATDYRTELRQIDPSVTYLMTLYLSQDISVDDLKQARSKGVIGCKMYPKGVTTNSSHGVEDIKQFSHLFEVMQDQGLMLLLHGEVPSNRDKDICVMNAEQSFLPVVRQLVNDYPKLKIVMEHVTTKESVDLVKELRSKGSLIAATITAHHLLITVDEAFSTVHNYCKPVAKFPHDLMALRQAALEDNGFFLGSDSAPHTTDKKAFGGCAGIFTSAHLSAYLCYAFKDLDSTQIEKFLQEFAWKRGTQFYGSLVQQMFQLQGTTLTQPQFKVQQGENVVPQQIGKVVPFLAGVDLGYKVQQ